MMQGNNEKENIGDKINGFVQKNRKGIFITFGIVIFLFVGIVAYLFISDYLNKKAIAEVDELNTRFTNLVYFINQGETSEDVNTLLADLEVFANKTSNFAGSKAWSLIGQIYSNKKDWEKAEETWMNAAKTGVKTYLGPIALFNAAVAAEEQGKIEKAIELLEQCVSHKIEFPSAARAQFNIGRLNEQLGNYDEALEAYRVVLIKWPDMPIFQYLARNQIIKIELR